MSWQFPFYILPSMVAIFITLGLVVLAYRRRTIPGVRIFLVITVGVTVWAIANVFENASVALDAKLLWSKIGYFGIVTAISGWPVFVFNQTGYSKWLTRRNLALLCIEPVLMLALVWTNELHGLVYASIEIQYVGEYTVADVTHGMGFWVHAVYAYSLLLGSTIILFRSLLRSPDIYRGQVTTLLVAALAPWIGNGLFLLGFSPVDLTPFAFSITGLSLAWGLFRFQLLDIVPVARDLVMENISDGVLVLDAQNRIVDLNAAARRMIGAEQALNLIGQPTDQVFSSYHDQVTQKLEREETIEIETGEGAAQRFFELQVSHLYNRSHRVTGRVVILHEITDHKRIEAQIRAQNEALTKTNQELELARNKAEEATRLKSQFLATMSHELRTPLNAIIGYSDIVLAGMTGELTPEQRNYQERVLANADHLLTLINDILDLSKVEAGRMDFTRKPFNLQSWLKDVEFQTRGLAEQKQLRLVLTLAPDLPPVVQGDAARLKQIALNLLSNAIKFTDEGSVRLDIRKADDETWALVVTDTGMGIPPHMHDVIFEEFRQVDGTSRRAYGGTGLGLAIVHKFVLMMGGNVRVDSEPGKGSIFTVTLPLVAEPEPVLEKDKLAHE
jgi:PAS domain S-box-containing protein